MYTVGALTNMNKIKLNTLQNWFENFFFFPKSVCAVNELLLMCMMHQQENLQSV